ncbi:MAG: efflux RND transporter periplasmic adaptor subunit [Phyllobacterium sp.]
MTPRKKGWALWGTGIGIAVSIFGAASLFGLPQNMTATAAAVAEQEAPPPAVPVTVSTVERRDVMTWNEFSGRLEAIDRVQIRSRVAGAIQSVHFREGALVKAGDLLVKIDPAPYAAAVAQAEGLVASAEARVEFNRTELERGRKLSENRTISQSDLDQRHSAYREAQATLRSAQAGLQAAQLDLDYTEVRAPISGRVGKLETSSGNLVAAGSASPALTTLVSVDPIYASFNISEELAVRTLAKLPPTNGPLPAIEKIPVEIGSLTDEGTPIKGHLQLIDVEVDAESGTIRARAVIDNPGGRLFPGQFVRVRMGQPKAEERVLVSERAIGTDQDKKFVFVVDGENKIVYRQIQPGATADGLRIVTSGLHAGERIVVNGLQRVRPGVIVDPQEGETVAAK